MRDKTKHKMYYPMPTISYSKSKLLPKKEGIIHYRLLETLIGDIIFCRFSIIDKLKGINLRLRNNT